MKGVNIIDIILAVVILPGMMFFFPIGEWAQWNSGKVLVFVLWIYAVYFLCRLVLGRLLWGGRRGLLTVAGAVFVIAAVNFLMTLTPVEIPIDPGQTLSPHVRAMWIMLFAVLGMGLPIGMLDAQVKVLSAHLTRENAVTDEMNSIQRRASDAVGDAEILLKSGYNTVHVPLSAIQYVESRNNYACFHIDHGEDVVTQMPLKTVLEMLPEGKYMRIHRSYVVPVWRIEKRSMTQVSILGVEEPLPVGRAYKDNLKNG